MMQQKIITTNDGSQSIFIPELNEHYHSSHGAVQEALHVFINAGLGYCASLFSEIKVLEVGFGTGLNALLSIDYALVNSLNFSYCGLEPFPVAHDFTNQLNYADYVSAQNAHFFKELHQLSWEEKHALRPEIHIEKRQCEVLNFNSAANYNLVYFDAFGYRVQEAMWSEAVFAKIYAHMDVGGVLVTYASKGVVRRTMQEVGFQVSKLAGPLGKREMVRATKQ